MTQRSTAGAPEAMHLGARAGLGYRKALLGFLFLLVLLAAGAALILLSGPPPKSGAVGHTIVRIDPPTQFVPIAGAVVFDVLVDDVDVGLGSHESEIDYDPTLLTFVDADNGDFLGSTGRTVALCISSDDPVVGTVRFGCVTQGETPAGATGSGVLATFTFQAISEGVSPLDFTAISSLGTVFGFTIPATFIGGSVTIGDITATPVTPTLTSTPCPGGICPTDTSTNTPTPETPTITPTPTVTRTPAPQRCSDAPTPTLPLAPTLTPPPQAAAICIVPVSQTVTSGSESGPCPPDPGETRSESCIFLQVNADNVTDIGAFQFEIVFNSALIEFVDFGPRRFCPPPPDEIFGCTPDLFSPFMESTGRTLSCLIPPTPTPGPPPTPTALPRDRVLIGCNTLGVTVPGDSPGPDGNGILIDIFLKTRPGAAGISSLNLDNVLLLKVRTANIPVTLLQGAAVNIRPPPTDTPTSTPTNTRTPTPTPTGPTATPTPTRTPTFTVTPCPLAGCPTATFTATPSSTPTDTATPTNTLTPTETLTFTPTATSTPGLCDSTPLTVVCIRPVSQDLVVAPAPDGSTPPPGTTLLEVAIENSPELGAFQFTLLYNPDLISEVSLGAPIRDPDTGSFVPLEAGPFLSSTGRITIGCIRPLLQFRVPGVLTFSCNTIAPPFGDPPGPSGGGVLAFLGFIGNVPGLSPLILQDVILTTVSGAPYPPPLLQGGSISIVPAPTETPTLTPTETLTPSPTITPGGPTLTPSLTPTETLTPTITLTPPATLTATVTPSPTATLGPLGLRLVPITQSFGVGETGDVAIVVDNVEDLGGFQFSIGFNPEVVKFLKFGPRCLTRDQIPQTCVVGSVVSPFLQSTGFTMVCVVPPTPTPEPVPTPTALPVEKVVIGCNTLGHPLGTVGVRGSGLLAIASFEGRSPGVSPLHLADVLLVTPFAGLIAPVNTQDAVILVEPGPPDTPTSTATATATATATVTSTPTGGGAGGAQAALSSESAALLADPATISTPSFELPVMRISPASPSVAVGEQATVNITVERAVNVESFGFTLNFDPLRIDFDSISSGAFLGSTGRATVCLPAVGANSVRFECNTFGTSPPGPNGSGLLATATFSGAAAGVASLHLSDVSLRTLSAGLPAQVIAQDAALVVTAPSVATPLPPSGAAGAPPVLSPLRAFDTSAPLVLARRVEGSRPAGIGAAPQAVELVEVRKVPERANVYIGDAPLTILETVSGIPAGNGLGAFELHIEFDASLLDVSIAEGDFLSSTGRTTHCLLESQPGKIGLTCPTSGSQPGPTGSGTLAVLTVQAFPGVQLRAAPANGIEVVLDNREGVTRLSDTLGNPIAVDDVGDSKLIVRALEGDINADCTVNVVDQQVVAGRFGIQEGASTYSPFFDLQPSVNPDGDIDVNDIEVVFGRVGSTCDNPWEQDLVDPKSTPTPQPTETATPTSTSSETPSQTPETPGPSSTPEPGPTATATSTSLLPTETPGGPGGPPQLTETATPTDVIPTETATETATEPNGTPTTKTETPTSTATATPTPTQTATPVATPTPTPTEQPTTPPPPTANPTATPTATTADEVTATTPPPSATPSALLGDVNCDGILDSVDPLLILQLLAAFLQSLSCESAADVDLNRNIDSLDALIILQFLAGLITQPS